MLWERDFLQGKRSDGLGLGKEGRSSLHHYKGFKKRGTDKSPPLHKPLRKKGGPRPPFVNRGKKKGRPPRRTPCKGNRKRGTMYRARYNHKRIER